MKQRLHLAKKCFAFLLAFAMVVTVGGGNVLTVSAAKEADTSLTTPVGLVANAGGADKITVVWGDVGAGYDSYCVTITGKDTEESYIKEYEGQSLDSHDYSDDYEEGKTYTVELQGVKGDAYSPVTSVEVKIPSTEQTEQADTLTPDPKEQSADGYIDLEQDQGDWYTGSTGGWGNAAATLTEEGVKAVIEATDFGSESSEWQIQYKIYDLGIDTGKTYKVEFDITSTVDKKVFVKLDNQSGLIAEAVSLTAGEKLHYEKEQKAGEWSAEPWLIFGLGQFAGENTGMAGTITIENVKLTEVTLTPEEVTPPSEDASYIDFELVDHSDTLDGVDVNVTYDGTTATATGFNWGGAWGGDSKWQIQLKTLVPVTTGKTYNFSFKIRSEVARNVFVKLGDVDNDGTVYWDGSVALAAGEEKIVSGKTTSAVAIEKLMFLVALGDQAPATQNTITVSDLAIYTDDSEYVEILPYISFEALDHSKDEATDVGVNIKYSGTTATITGNDWGGDWGGDSKWQIQLKELIPVAANDTYEFSFTIKSETARSLFLKLGDVANDNTVFYQEDITLEAGVEKTISGRTTGEVTIDQLMVLFALGDQNGAVENTITISNLLLKGEKSGYVKVNASGNTPSVEKGKEYDFTATEDNAANDYADPGTVKAGYTLIWADEFDGNYGSANVDANGLNLDNWAYQLGDGTTDCSNPGWGNNELQAYTGNNKNIAVNEDLDGDGQGNGLLRITASYEPGYTYGTESAKNYTSARIRTTKPDGALFTTTYGYIEARMSLPETQGAWPAFWMLPESTSIYGGWPVSGELDIMETTGINSSSACGTLHWGAPDHVYKGSGYVEVDSEIAYFHTYAVDWQPNSITWYYDGVPIYTSTNWESGYTGASDKLSFDAPFDQPFYVLLNLAVDSGQFGGSANKAGFQDDINMYVDYVRVYQKTEGYPAYAEKTASGSVADDWQQYAGVNQIADITAGNIEAAMGSDSATDNAKWYLSTNANGVGGAVTAETVEDSDGKVWAKLNITEAGSQDYAVQLIGHYDAKNGYVYKVSFDVYAEGDMVGKKVNSDSKEWAGWSANGIQSFELKDTQAKVSYLFEQKEDFDKCRIEFNLGAVGTGTVYIGNVRVEIVDPSLIGGEADSDSRTALSDGNVIYNGTFDQGSKHVGYWSVLEGTTLTVPRYTTVKIGADDVSVVDVASKTNYENIADGVKYYERRAQIQAAAGVNPVIYQNGFKMGADEYTLAFDMYSAKDTTVTVAIYSTDENGNLKEQIKASTIAYKAADGVKSLGMKFEMEEEIANAALVLKFDKGAFVMVDNVSMIGASLGEKADPEPVTGDTTWTADNGAGSALTLKTENNVWTLENVQSGSNWYSPQIQSQNFQLVAGKQYELTFKYKLEGTSNNTFQYIIQENNGSWHVYNNGPTEVTYDVSGADADGFCTYTVKFTADVSLNTVHLVFGLGGSGASGAADFSFKDVAMNLVEIGSGDEDDPADTWTDVTDNILDGIGNAGNTGNTGNTGSTGNSGAATGTATVNAANSGNQAGSAQKAPEVTAVDYIVVKGDSLTKIARKFGLTVVDLIALNPQIKNPNLIYPGQVIHIILGEGSAPLAERADGYYTVVRGDNLYKIARQHKMTLSDLYVLNPTYIKRKYIYAGEKIRVQ